MSNCIVYLDKITLREKVQYFVQIIFIKEEKIQKLIFSIYFFFELSKMIIL